MSEFLRQYRQLMRLTAEAGGLEWGKDSVRIRDTSIEIEGIRKDLDLQKIATRQVSGFYWCEEQLSDLWIVGEVEHDEFAFHAVNFLARELDSQTYVAIHTAIGLANLFGATVVNALFDLVDEAMQGIRFEHRRLETCEEDEASGNSTTIYAGLLDEDDRFVEAGAPECSPDDEGATKITIVTLDFDAWFALNELIEERDQAARRALRNECATTGTPLQSTTLERTS